MSFVIIDNEKIPMDRILAITVTAEFVEVAYTKKQNGLSTPATIKSSDHNYLIHLEGKHLKYAQGGVSNGLFRDC